MIQHLPRAQKEARSGLSRVPYGRLVMVAMVFASLLVGVLTPRLIGALPPLYVMPTLLALGLSLILVLPFIVASAWAVEPVTFVVIVFFGYVAGSLYDVFARDLSMGSSREVGGYLGQKDVSVLLSRLLLYCVLGILSFYLAYYWPRSSTSVGLASRRSPKCSVAYWPHRPFRWTIIFLSVVGLAAYSAFGVQAGGLAHFVTHLRARGNVPLGKLRNGADWLAVASILWFAQYLRGRASKLWWIHVLLSSLVLASLGSRSKVLTFWLMLGVLYYSSRDVKGQLVQWGILGLVLWSVVQALLFYRRTTYYGDLSIERVLDGLRQGFEPSNFLETMVGRSDWADVSIFSELISRMPQDLPFQYGSTFLRWIPLIAPVPQFLLPFEGSLTVGKMVAEALYPGRSAGLSSTFLAELYMNFHVPGIIGGMLLFGWFCRWLYRYYLRNRADIGAQTTYAVVVVRIVLHGATSDTSRAVPGTLFYLVPLLLAIWYLNKSARNRAVSSGCAPLGSVSKE